jgi:hypothetical protein
MSTRRYWLSASSLVFAAGLLYSVFLLPYVRTFHISGDDFALVLNSARQYHPNPLLWLTRGFSSYFVAYPDLPERHTDFCRPLVNATFWLESLLSPGAGPLWLTTNFVGLAATLVLFMFFVRRQASGKMRFFASTLILYAFSAMWYGAVTSPWARGSLLMVLFALAAFLLLPREASAHQGLRISLSVVSQMASLLSHETGAVTPVIAALLFIARRDGKVDRERLKTLPLFLLPLLCYAVLRLAFCGGMPHAYVLEPEHGWVRTAIVNAVELLAEPFFPWETSQVTSGEWSLRVVSGVLMNLAGYVLISYAVLRPGKGRRGPLLRILLCLGTALAALWMAPAARFMPLAGVFGALATMLAGLQISECADWLWARRGAALVLVGLAAGQLLVFLTSFPRVAAEGEAGNRQARLEFQGLQEVIATAKVGTLLLVNDASGWTSTRAMLEMAAWPNRGRVRRLITADNFIGGSSPQSSLRLSRDGQAVRIEIGLGAGQRFAFGNVVESQLSSKFVHQGLQYEIETSRGYSFIARVLRRLGKRVQPDKVTIGRRLVVTVPPEIARDGLLIVGFDPRNMSSFSNWLFR